VCMPHLSDRIWFMKETNQPLHDQKIVLQSCWRGNLSNLQEQIKYIINLQNLFHDELCLDSNFDL
jgi:hypothetical protein